MLQNSLTVTHIMCFKKSCLVFSYTNVIDDINKVQKHLLSERQTDRWIDKQTNRKKGGYLDECCGGQTYGQKMQVIDKLTNGWTDRWTERWTEGWTERWTE